MRMEKSKEEIFPVRTEKEKDPMGINFGMWKNGITTLVKIEKKEEWDRLDVVSKWLIATRSAVTVATLFSGAIGGLLAWRDGHFNFVPWLIVTLGLFLAHGANNLFNDYVDFQRGVDQPPYFRTQYSVHPLVQKFWSPRRQLLWFSVTGTLAFLSGVYALWYTAFSPVVIALFAFGSIVLLFYTFPLKSLALGELLIFLIWGPIMVAGVYVVLAGGAWTGGAWSAALAGVPFGLCVASINIGKHIDKMADDAGKGIHTLPVLFGETAARAVNILSFVLMYGIILYLIFVTRYFTPLMLFPFLAGRRAVLAVAVMGKPRPAAPPEKWTFWPTWFSAFTFNHFRLFAVLFVLALFADIVVRMSAPGFWPGA
jgi:1,4-dihydroxy-2-naphthoate octaprenyltransferase